MLKAESALLYKVLGLGEWDEKAIDYTRLAFIILKIFFADILWFLDLQVGQIIRLWMKVILFIYPVL